MTYRCGRFGIQVLQDLLDHQRILNAGGHALADTVPVTFDIVDTYPYTIELTQQGQSDVTLCEIKPGVNYRFSFQADKGVD